MSVEAFSGSRQKASALYPLLIEDGVIQACASLEGNEAEDRYRYPFARDFFRSTIAWASSPLNYGLPGVIQAVMKTSDFFHQHKGQSFNPEKDEYFGKTPHEILLPAAHLQNRAEELLKAGMPVDRNKSNGRLQMINYFAGDATSLHTITEKAIAQVIDTISSPETGTAYLAATFPKIAAGIEHDNNNADEYGMGLIVTDPKNSCNFKQQVWRDGTSAYIGEDGRKLDKPYIFLSNASHYIHSLKAGAEIAQRLNHSQIARQWEERAERGSEQLDKLFWNGEYYAPVYDSQGRMDFVNCDPIDALVSGVVPSDRVPQVIQRLMADDMLTPYGIRTRSEKSTQYSEIGTSSYQNGSVWPWRSMEFVRAAFASGHFEEGLKVMSATEKYIQERGFSELGVVTKDGHLTDYVEERNGMLIPASCGIQAWNVFCWLGVTALLMEASMKKTENLPDDVSFQQTRAA